MSSGFISSHSRVSHEFAHGLVSRRSCVALLNKLVPFECTHTITDVLRWPGKSLDTFYLCELVFNRGWGCREFKAPSFGNKTRFMPKLLLSCPAQATLGASFSPRSFADLPPSEFTLTPSPIPP